MEGFAHDYADIFHRVMFVDIDIAPGLNGQVEETVLGQQFQHVIEESNPCIDLSMPIAIERPFDRDIRLLRGPVN
jgi:hypothetical protein